MWIPLLLFLHMSSVAQAVKTEIFELLTTVANKIAPAGAMKNGLSAASVGFDQYNTVKTGKATANEVRSVIKYLEQMKLDVLRSYSEQQLMSSRKSFGELLSQAKNLMQLFEDLIEFPEDKVVQKRFMDETKATRPYAMILTIKGIIGSDYNNILEDDMGGDIFHQLKTLRKTRNDVITLLDMLCVLEVFTISLEYPDIYSEPFKTNVNRLGSLIDSICESMDTFIDDFESREYFNKVEHIIAAVMVEKSGSNKSARADALMYRLGDIYTKDRFIVAIFDDDDKCDVRRVFDAEQTDVAVSLIHNTIVYRSKKMGGYKKADFDKIATELSSAVAELSGLCSDNYSKSVRAKVAGAGFVVHDHHCAMEVRSDPRTKRHEEASFDCYSKSIGNMVGKVVNITKEKELSNPLKRAMRVIAYPY